MPQTPLGLTYPEAGDHTRLWEHFQALADGVDGLLNPGGGAVLPWIYRTIDTWTFTNGSKDVTYGGTTPDGWEWVTPLPIFDPRSNSFPSASFAVTIGNVSATGCTVHMRRTSDNAPASGSVPVSFGLVGFIRRIP